MVISRWPKAIATGAMVLASMALVLFVSSVFSHSFPQGGVKKFAKSCHSMKGGCMHHMMDEERGNGEMMPMDSSIAMPALPPFAIPDSMPMTLEKTMPGMMGGSVVGTDRKVSTTASLDMRAKSLDWTVNKVREIVKNVGGFVENSSTTQPDRGIRIAWMTVKVPTDRFDTTLAEIKQSADQVTNENVGSLDMTAQDIDLSARLNNKRAEEQAYADLLDSATRVTDVIEITQQLTQVRSEIESLEQQLRYLEGQTALVTLHLNITEDPQVAGGSGEFKRGNVFKMALNTLVDALLALGTGLVIFLISGLPILLILLGLIWVIYRITKRVVNGFFSRI